MGRNRIQFLVLYIVIVNVFHQTEIHGSDTIVRSKAANLIRRILSSEILSPDSRYNFLFQNAGRQRKIEETDRKYEASKKPVDLEKMLIRASPESLVNKSSSPNKDITQNIIPLWHPKSAVKRNTTRRPYIISFTPYTTPTPFPVRQNWTSKDWVKYLNKNHPNFWFQNQLKQISNANANLTHNDDKRLFIDLPVQCMKTTSSEHVHK